MIQLELRAMSLKTLKNFSFLLTGLLLGCSSSFTPGGGITPDPSLSSPTATVVANVGSTNQMILEDELGFINSLEDDMPDIINDAAGTSLGGSGSNRYVIRQARGDSDISDVEDIVTIDTTEDCTGGGTVQFIGDFDLTLTRLSAAGTFVGDYSIIYTNCTEEILFTASDSSCAVTTEVTGTFNNSLSLSFYEIDPSYNFSRVEIRDSVASNGPIEFVIESGSAQTVTYDYDLYTHTQASSETYTGDLTFDGLQYDVTALRDFIETATASSICP